MPKKTFLFYLNTFNDTDHIAPIIYKFLEKGEIVKVVYLSDFGFENDYRIKFLKKYKNFYICRSTKWMHLKNKISNKFLIIFLRLFLPKFFKKYICELLSPELKNVACVVYEWGEPNRQSFLGAKALSIPTVCIPHGLNIFKNYDVNNHIKNIKEETGRWPNHTHRNRFDAYIFQSLRHFKMACAWGHDPKKTFIWGSARFDPKWSKINLELMDAYKPKIIGNRILKIIFFMPHWSYNVNIDKTIECIKRILIDNSILLVIKGHTRGTGSLSSKNIESLKEYKNIVINANAHSPSLIQWSDIVINFGSSIGIEAIIQKKNIINPIFLHSNSTIFDNNNLTNIASNIDEVLALIESEKSKKINLPKENFIRDFMNLEVYANTEKKDVLETYYQNISNKNF